jgi:hypothetical protein
VPFQTITATSGNFARLNFSNTILPTTSGTLNIGSDVQPVKNIYAENFVKYEAPVGGVYISGNAVATPLTQNVWTQPSGTWQNGSIVGPDFTVTYSPPSIKFNGGYQAWGRINFVASITSATNGQTLEIGLTKDGTLLAPSIFPQRYSNTDILQQFSSALISMVSGTTFGIQIRNITGNNNFTIQYGNLTVMY